MSHGQSIMPYRFLYCFDIHEFFPYFWLTSFQFGLNYHFSYSSVTKPPSSRCPSQRNQCFHKSIHFCPYLWKKGITFVKVKILYNTTIYSSGLAQIIQKLSICWQIVSKLKAISNHCNSDKKNMHAVRLLARCTNQRDSTNIMMRLCIYF